MKLVASRDVALRPQNLAREPDGDLLLHRAGHYVSFLEAYDPDLVLMWSVRSDWQPIEQMLLARDRTVWVLDRAGASTFDFKGNRVARVQVGVPEAIFSTAEA